MFFQKLFLPWTAADQFDTPEAFQDFLKTRQKQLTNHRIFWLLPAFLCLFVGYCLDLRPILVLTVLPLAVVLLLTIMLERTEAALNGRNNHDDNN